ncbi:Cytochrome P450 [Micromonospora halophytica]|uniref:Cytochrome P450 n=2 Tax=Micromonospora halophytica TaxID=47864 RepID=A0A1C5ILE0_9ACTN|nr:Cytochrome P450 [Micromonospora halophytica]
MGGPHIPEKMRDMLALYQSKRQSEPVSLDETSGRWQVFGYRDGVTVATDAKRFSNDLSAFIPDHEELKTFTKGNFQAMDDPRHRQMRSLVSQGFTPKFVQGLAPRIEQVATELLDRIRDQGRDRIDLVGDLAHPLPVTVIAEVMGLPVADRHLFRKWADALLVDNGVDALFSEEGVAAMAPSIREMNQYLLSHVREYRASDKAGLIRALVAAETDGRRLDDQEIVGFLALLLIAGHLTTSTMFTNAILCLDENPGAMKEIRADRGLIPDMLEEVLRYRSPLVWLDRRATEDVELGGKRIPEGSLVSVSLVSVGRDESEFKDPDTFDIHREQIRHLAFGMGIHFCLGAPLARMEVRIALNAMLDRYDDFRIPTDEPIVFHDPKDFNGTKYLPLDLVVR